MTKSQPQKQVAGPTTQRIEILDIIRGFALVGILYANILSWSGIKFLPFETIKSFGNINVDMQIYHYLKFFIDTKFYTIFSLLFGIGFSLQIIKNKDNPGFLKLYSRRLVILLMIGLLHASIWSGDILMLYALMGFILLSLRNLDTKKTFKTGLILYFIPLILDIVYMYTFAPEIETPVKTALSVYPDMSPEQVIAGFQSPQLLTVLKTNYHNLIWRWYGFIPSGRPFKVLGLFLLGSYLYSSGYFTKHVHKYKLMLLWLTLGLVFTYISIQMGGSLSSFSKDWSNWLYKVIHEIGQISLSLGYISILAILLKAIPQFFLWNILKAYGRMSMSSYIGHTLLGIFIFYPVVGLALHGQLSLENTYYVATAILIFQLTFSTLWFKWFKFGPIEWVWRCITYKHYFPILKK